MILSIWIVLLAFSLILIIAGKYTDAPPLQIGGYSFVFILGLVMMLGGLQYQIGENTLHNYTYSGNNISFINETSNYIYGDYDSEIVQGITINHTIGFFMSVLSIFGFMSVFFNLGRKPFNRKPRNVEAEDYEY